jgi:hypothetical protein
MVRSSWLVFALGSLLLAGCAGGYGYYATTAPPPLQAEAYGVAPGPGYVWINGYWGGGGGGYSWVPGRWERPPHPGAHWEQPRWEHHGNGYRFHQGHWR